jgi:hypothetical protein
MIEGLTYGVGYRSTKDKRKQREGKMASHGSFQC